MRIAGGLDPTHFSGYWIQIFGYILRQQLSVLSKMDISKFKMNISPFSSPKNLTKPLFIYFLPKENPFRQCCVRVQALAVYYAENSSFSHLQPNAKESYSRSNIEAGTVSLLARAQLSHLKVESYCRIMPKMQLFGKNATLWQKCNFVAKMQLFGKNATFWQKCAELRSS